MCLLIVIKPATHWGLHTPIAVIGKNRQLCPVRRWLFLSIADIKFAAINNNEKNARCVAGLRVTYQKHYFGFAKPA